MIWNDTYKVVFMRDLEGVRMGSPRLAGEKRVEEKGLNTFLVTKHGHRARRSDAYGTSLFRQTYDTPSPHL